MTSHESHGSTPASGSSSHEWVEAWRRRIEEYLGEVVDAYIGKPTKLREAVAWALLGGGKRLRPLVCLAAARAVGGDEALALPAAAAVECVHSYSLVHDDMPCMDDDALRRGKPATHVQFGEAMALLCGDALLTLAFELSTAASVDAGVPAERAVRAAGLLARAAGGRGMVLGQAGDIEGQGRRLDAEQVEWIHRHKTGALLAAAAATGAVVGGGDDTQVDAAHEALSTAGLAFQVIDDVLDATADTQALGKPAGSDASRELTTFVDLYGVDEAVRLARRLARQALEPLAGWGTRADALRHLVRALVERGR